MPALDSWKYQNNLIMHLARWSSCWYRTRCIPPRRGRIIVSSVTLSNHYQPNSRMVSFKLQACLQSSVSAKQKRPSPLLFMCIPLVVWMKMETQVNRTMWQQKINLWSVDLNHKKQPKTQKLGQKQKYLCMALKTGDASVNCMLRCK